MSSHNPECHEHHHHHHAPAIEQVQAHEHGHSCGCIHVHEGSLCARGMCNHLEHALGEFAEHFRNMLEPSLDFDDDDEEDDDEMPSASHKKQSKRKLKFKPVGA